MVKKIKPTIKKSSRQPQGKQTTTHLTAQQFSGPVPPPEILKGYDIIIPGAAERILVMAEKEQAHAIAMDQSTQQNISKEIKRGQYFGLFVTIAAFITSGFALYLGYEKAAMIIGGSTVVGLVTVFVAGRTIKTK